MIKHGVVQDLRKCLSCVSFKEKLSFYVDLIKKKKKRKYLIHESFLATCVLPAESGIINFVAVQQRHKC